VQHQRTARTDDRAATAGPADELLLGGLTRRRRRPWRCRCGSGLLLRSRPRRRLRLRGRCRLLTGLSRGRLLRGRPLCHRPLCCRPLCRRFLGRWFLSGWFFGRRPSVCRPAPHRRLRYRYQFDPHRIWHRPGRGLSRIRRLHDLYGGFLRLVPFQRINHRQFTGRCVYRHRAGRLAGRPVGYPRVGSQRLGFKPQRHLARVELKQVARGAGAQA